MRIRIVYVLLATALVSCMTKTKDNKATKQVIPIIGTWQLITGIVIEKGDTTVTDYTKNKSFIKIINNTHFAFLQHDLNKGKDSATASFSSGGGKYTLTDSLYIESLEYCSAREWEGNNFALNVAIKNDTLTQRGVEKVEGTKIDRINIERYVRLK